MEREKLYFAGEVADILSVSIATVYNYRKEGTINFVQTAPKAGYAVRESELKRFMIGIGLIDSSKSIL